MYIFTGPHDKFSETEVTALRQYVKNGGSVLFHLGEGGEEGIGTNINYFFEQYGIFVNNDTVIRTAFHKYYHPKEVCVENGILNRGINKAAGKIVSNNNASNPADKVANTAENITFVYPYGATINVEKPAVPILSSGFISYPVNRPVGAVYSSAADQGRIAVLGSLHLFEDNWLDKEENSKLQEVIFKWLLKNKEVVLNQIDAESPELNDYHYLPDSESLAERVKPCLQESEELPRDFSALLNNSKPFKLDVSLVPETIKLYQKFNVKHEPLSLIPPVFEAPLPSLNPAVYPPSLREPNPPALDLFDLDEQFASEEIRLAHLTNRCTNEDLEYYVKRCGEILGVTERIQKDSAKHILEFVLKQITNFKKTNLSQMDTNNNYVTNKLHNTSPISTPDQ